MRRAKWSVGAVVLIAVAATAGAVLVVLRSSLRRMETGSSQTEAAPDASAVLEGETGLALESAPEAEARPAKSTPRELPDGVWIRGRVVVPAGTPADEKVEIAARVLSFDDAPGYVAEMGADGGFAVMFPKEVDSGWIEMHARYLVLEPNQPVDLEEPPEEIVLEPVLGGRVRGRIVAPGRDESEIRRLAGTFVELSADTGPGIPRFHARRMRVERDLHYEFLALPPIEGYELAARAQNFLPFEEDVEIPPGTTTEVDIVLHPGARVSGRILDAKGQPVEKAKIWRTEVPPREDPRRAEAQTMSRKDGSFVMTAIPPGEVAIAFKVFGCLREIVELGRLEDGEVRAGIEVRLRTSLVQGRVEWPDGKPAYDAEVELLSWVRSEKRPDFVLPDSVRSQVYNGGRFTFEAVSEGPLTLTARSPGRSDLDSDDESAAVESGIVRVEGVQPSTDPIVLVLEPGQVVRGRVVDDVGNPVTDCLVRGDRVRGAGFASLDDSVLGRSTHPDGAFVIGGLSRGSWTFSASVEKRVSRHSPPVDLPNGGTSIVIVIPRGAAVSGIVVDPEGHPVAGAGIRSELADPAISGANGEFALSGLSAGLNMISASAAGYGPSKLVTLRLVPGGSIADVRLVLRLGGSIVCEVLDAEGHPDPGRQVAAWGPGNEGFQSVESDEEGHAVFEDLAPGAYNVARVATNQERDAQESSAPNLWTRFAAARTQASVDVVAGAEMHVVIGGPKRAPIRVRGRVTDGGAPAAGVAMGSGWTDPSQAQENEWTTDTEGRFEFIVPEAGNLELWLHREAEGSRLTTLVRITDPPRGELELVLPQGRASGVVLSSGGHPQDEVTVLLHSDQLADSPGEWSADSGTKTVDGGHFAFRNLPAGHYELQAFVRPVAEEGISTILLDIPEGGVLDDVVIRLP